MNEFKFHEDYIISELNKEGRVLCHMLIPGYQGEDATNAIYGAVNAWNNCSENDEPMLEIYFMFDEALDSIIDSYECGKGGPIDAEAKPVINAMRKELAGMIARIDALRFTEA